MKADSSLTKKKKKKKTFSFYLNIKFHSFFSSPSFLFSSFLAFFWIFFISFLFEIFFFFVQSSYSCF